MRGKRFDDAILESPRRIIPAHAGQTWTGLPNGIDARDHPRACGANRKRLRRVVLRRGSSPRMRGKPYIEAARAVVDRIIPAHAGQTQS